MSVGAMVRRNVGIEYLPCRPQLARLAEVLILRRRLCLWHCYLPSPVCRGKMAPLDYQEAVGGNTGCAVVM